MLLVAKRQQQQVVVILYAFVVTLCYGHEQQHKELRHRTTTTTSLLSVNQRSCSSLFGIIGTNDEKNTILLPSSCGMEGIETIPRGGSSSSSSSTTTDADDNSSSSSLDEDDYNRYINCFVALERLRQIRDSVSTTIQSATTKATQYIDYSTQIIHAMGMTIEQYNTIGTTIQNNATLKENVLEKVDSIKLAIASIKPTVGKKTYHPISNDKFQKFCSSMVEVEQLRRSYVNDIQQTYQLDDPKVPLSLTRRNKNNVIPLLDTSVQNMIHVYPILASTIVQKYNMSNQEFNEILDRTRTSIFFRNKVLRNVKKIERKLQQQRKQ